MKEKSGSYKSKTDESASSNSESIISSKTLLQQKKPCITKVNRNKYEHASSASQKYWDKTFENLEKQSAIPYYKRKTHLKKCFSKDVLKKLIDIGVECHQDWDEGIEQEKDVYIVEPLQEVNLLPRRIKQKEPEREYTNPYLNFFKKSKKDAQIWRPRPPPPVDSLPIIEKAKAVEEKLATDFDEWFSNVGSSIKSEINKDVILSIFEILITYPVKISMTEEIKEIGCVPEMTAKYLGFPEKSESNSVQREIHRDIDAGHMLPMLVSFFKTLPDEMKREPFKENLEDKWFTYQTHHVDIETMAAVWKGITDLHTTQLFIDFLLNHPAIPPPPYLKNEGFMRSRSIMMSGMDLAIDESLEWDLDTSFRRSIRKVSNDELRSFNEDDEDFQVLAEY